MSSLDIELQDLQRPIPKGTDLNWLTSGDTFYQSDTINPNAQAHNVMSQMAFNRVITKTVNCNLMPEERAVGQTVIAHINAGYTGPQLDGALLNIFGKEVFVRHAAFIQDVKVMAENNYQIPEEIQPKVGVHVASPIMGKSDREELRKHAVKMSTNALESYRISGNPSYSVQISEPEVEVSLENVSKDQNVELRQSSLDQIKLAAQSLINDQNDLEFSKQQDVVSSNLFENESINILYHPQETDLISAGNNDLDLVFNNDPISLGNDGFDLSVENAIIGCDEDISEVAAVPPTALLQGDFNLYDLESCPAEEESEIDLSEKEEENNLEIGMSNDFDVEI